MQNNIFICHLNEQGAAGRSPVPQGRHLWQDEGVRQVSDTHHQDHPGHDHVHTQVSVHLVRAGEGEVPLDPRHHHLPAEDVQGQPRQEGVQVVFFLQLFSLLIPIILRRMVAARLVWAKYRKYKMRT